MAAAEVLTVVDGPLAAGTVYTLTQGEEFEPTCVQATWDGSGAAGDFLPCCSFYSQDGRLLARVFPSTVKAGDTAVVTYSPFALPPSAQASGTVSASGVFPAAFGSGRWYSGLHFTNNLFDTTNPPVNTVIAYPLFFPVATALDRIGVRLTTNGGAGCRYRLGLYADDGTGRPGARLLDAGQVVTDAGSPVGRTIVIAQTVGPGEVWVAGVTQGVAAGGEQFLQGKTSWLSFPLEQTDPTSGSVAGTSSLSVAGVAGALPDPFGAPTIRTQACPLIFVRAA